MLTKSNEEMRRGKEMQELLEKKLKDVEGKFKNLEKEKEELESQNQEEKRRVQEELKRLQQQEDLENLKMFSEKQIDKQISQAEQIIKSNREENMLLEASHLNNEMMETANENKNAINLNQRVLFQNKVPSIPVNMSYQSQTSLNSNRSGAAPLGFVPGKIMRMGKGIGGTNSVRSKAGDQQSLSPRGQSLKSGHEGASSNQHPQAHSSYLSTTGALRRPNESQRDQLSVQMHAYPDSLLSKNPTEALPDVPPIDEKSLMNLSATGTSLFQNQGSEPQIKPSSLNFNSSR